MHDGSTSPGRDSFKAHMRDLFDAFPDFGGTLEDLIACDDKVVCRGVFRGTQERELMGIPANDHRVQYRVIENFRLENGRIVEHWQQSDTLKMFEQLGLVPELVPGG